MGGSGFPHLVAMDADGKVVGELKGQRSVDGFRELMKAGQSFVDLRARAEKGDGATKIEYFTKALELGHFSLKDGKAYFAALKDVPAESKTQIDGLLAGVEMKEALAPLMETRDQVKRKQLQVEVGRKLWEMDKAGRIPGTEDDLLDFYALIVIAAEEDKNIPAFEKGLEQLKERFGDKVKRFTDAKDAVLAKLKEEKEEKK